jgi:multiple sugar transport system permease protein
MKKFWDSLSKFFAKIGAFFRRLGLAIAAFFKRIWPPVRDFFKKCGHQIVRFFRWFLKPTNEKRAPVATLLIICLLVLLGFVYVYPFLYMIAYSFMDEADVVNPLVKYVPTHLVIDNYVAAIKTLNYGPNLGMSLLVAFLPSVFQCISTSLVAYALSRFQFKGKKFFFAGVLITFLVPSQVTMVPTIITLTKIKLIDTLWSYIAMAGLGQGLRSAVFVLIFYQFFNQIPKSIEESCEIDGANPFVIFWKIGIPTAKSAYIMSFLLSFVWYYNETTLSTIYLGGKYPTLVSQLLVFKSTYEALYSGANINEAIYMAGTLMTILPLVIIYFLMQNFFVQGIDKAGITGE